MPDDENHKKRYVLQNLTLNLNADSSESPLYSIPTRSERGVSFHTYFNSYSIDKWRQHAKIEHVGLSVEGYGTGTLVIRVEITPNVYRTLFREEVDLRRGVSTDEFSLSDLRGFLFVEFYPTNQKKEFRISQGSFWTTSPPKRSIQLSIVVTTFKREGYIRNLLELFETESLHNIDDIHRTFLRIIDNGNTLIGDCWRAPENVGIIPNPNLGGAGGFSRGMIESLADIKTTHILLMDDDVVVPPEAVRRTVRMMAYVDDCNAVIGGAMLDATKRWVMHEQGGRIRRYRAAPLKAQLDLRKKHCLWLLSEEEHVDYYGWWFFCMPSKVCKEIGLALPIFFRGDDIDYCSRIREKLNCDMFDLNGICVWHENFLYKENPIQMYYDMRNQLLINPSVRAKEIPRRIRVLINVIWYIMPVLRGHRYMRTKFILRAINDFLRGPEFLANTNSGKLHSELLSERDENIKILPAAEFDVQRFDKCARMRVSVFWRLVSKITFSGILLPSFLRKRHKEKRIDAGVIYHPLQTGTDIPSLCKNVRAQKIIYIERNTRMGYSVKVDSWIGIKLLTYLCITLASLCIKYRSVAVRYRAARTELTDEKIWNNFLFPGHN